MTDLYRLPARYRTWFKFAFAHGGTKLTGQSPSHIRGAVTSMQTKFVSSLITLCHIPLCCKTNFSVGTEHPMSLDPLSTTNTATVKRRPKSYFYHVFLFSFTSIFRHISFTFILPGQLGWFWACNYRIFELNWTELHRFGPSGRFFILSVMRQNITKIRIAAKLNSKKLLEEELAELPCLVRRLEK